MVRVVEVMVRVVEGKPCSLGFLEDSGVFSQPISEEDDWVEEGES